MIIEQETTDRAAADPSGARTESCAQNSPGARPEALAQRHQRIVQSLTDMALELAEAARAQALDEIAEARARKEAAVTPVIAGKATPGADAMLAFARMSRAARQAMALEARLEQEQLQRAERRAAADTVVASAAEEESRYQAERQLKRTVEQALETQVAASDARQLREDVRERLDDPDEWEDLADRPVGEIIARLCRDLDITPDCARWAGEEWFVPADWQPISKPVAKTVSAKPVCRAPPWRENRCKTGGECYCREMLQAQAARDPPD